MGASSSAFTDEELDDYQDLTFFTKNEILRVYKRFRLLAAQQMEKVAREITDREARECVLSLDTVQNYLPELRVNPFCDRICHVFSSEGNGSLSFEDFLDMMSVFSDSAPKSVKVEYAFRIYDFDSDDMLSEGDLKEVIDRLTGGKQEPNQRLSEDDMAQLIDNINNEADLDEDNQLSFAEFEHVISKAPDFITSFRIRL